MSNEIKPAVDTELRTLNEVLTRLIVPVPQRLIDTKTDSSRAEYINVTTQKDLLDLAVGHGRWRVEIMQTIPAIHTAYQPKNKPVVEGALFGMIVRLHIQTADEGWVYQDGTGTETLTGSPVYGDPLTNAYAQALRRACESFGMARELWRRELVPAQRLAQRAVSEAGTAIPKAPADESEGSDVDRNALANTIISIYTKLGYTQAQLDKMSAKIPGMSDRELLNAAADAKAKADEQKPELRRVS